MIAETMEDHRYRVAVWIVIASEVLLFAGLFALYWSYRSEYHAAFDAGVQLDVQWIGGVNTFLLLASSFAIAWALYLTRHGRGGAAWWLLGVIVLGVAFSVLKLVEWGIHADAGIVAGAAYYHGPQRGRGTELFFTLYYLMTGLHLLHLFVGIALVVWVLIRVRAHTITRDHHLALELVALYWSFVDVVWMFLWPMFYLMHR